jgi:hypothetical protein
MRFVSCDGAPFAREGCRSGRDGRSSDTPFAAGVRCRDSLSPMSTLRARLAVLAVLALTFSPGSAAVPDYKLGDIAAEDVITPVPLVVPDPEATEALKQRIALQVPFIVCQTAESAAAAERELRESIATARRNFLTSLQLGDIDAPPYVRVIQEIAGKSPKDLPFDRFAPLWVRGIGDETLVEGLVQPLREVMLQPILPTKTDVPLPVNQPVRLVPAKSATELPTLAEIEAAAPVSVSSGKVLSLWRARRLVETAYPAGQEALGRFAASFVRSNAWPEQNLTNLMRAKRIEGLSVNETYDAAQVILRKGETVDRKTLGALSALREKSLIGTLQTRLDQEQSVAGRLTQQTKWIVASLGVVCVGFFLILWRLRPRASTALVMAGNPALGGGHQALPGGDPGSWRERAIVAEGKAERAHHAIRSGVLGWMKEKIVHTLFSQRAQLLSAQQRAEAEMRELEQRLEQLHTPLRERIAAYERRIEELEQDLAAKGEENRELIDARISVAKQQLMVERERGGFGTN